MEIVKINRKQTKITLEDGSRFKAARSIGRSCLGCTFKELNITCPRMPAEHGISGPAMCTPDVRTDESHIIWIRRKEKQDGS